MANFLLIRELCELKKITIREEKRTRKGTVEKEVEKVQWVEARHDAVGRIYIRLSGAQNAT